MSIAYWLLVITLTSIAQELAASTAPRMSRISEQRRTQRPLITNQYAASSPKNPCYRSCLERIQVYTGDDYLLAFCNCVYFPVFALLACCEHCNCTARPESHWKEKYRAEIARKVAEQAALGSSSEAK